RQALSNSVRHRSNPSFAFGPVSMDAQKQFPPGSMGPKIEAAAQFLAKKGGEVLLTDASNLKEAAKGKAGTKIYHKLNREIA
ncbi:MAG: hypothetical protein N2445_02890, partial [Acidobacteria bacterium]|nr:hypothetical protein [Acidobacteriota bacterium]